MRKGDKRRDWTTSDLAYLKANAGRVPIEIMAQELKRSRESIRQKAKALGVSLRYWQERLVWCNDCATLRTSLDDDGRCPVCRAREQLERAEARVAEALRDLDAETRELYASTESLRSSEAVHAPWPDMRGLTPYEQRKAEDAYRRAVEGAEVMYLQRQINSTKTRLKRIREKAGTNPRKTPRH